MSLKQLRPDGPIFIILFYFITVLGCDKAPATGHEASIRIARVESTIHGKIT